MTNNKHHNDMNPKEEKDFHQEEETLNSQTAQQEQSEEKTSTDTNESEEKTDKNEQEPATDKNEELQNELDSLKDKYLRLSAEFDNYRKRTMKEKAELILNGGEKCISSILPIVDDMERALKNMETAIDVNAVKEGVLLIYNKFITTLEKNGVKMIETQDKPLDTDFHEAIAVIPAPSEEQKGKIIDCVQTGYTLNNKVIRHAKVVVGE